MTANDQSTRTLEVTFRNGTVKHLTMPATWKVTFGPLVPGSHANGTLYLRLYEAKDKQRAVYANVSHFRDLLIAEEVMTSAEQVAEDSIVRPKARRADW